MQTIAAVPAGFASPQFEQVWRRADGPVASGQAQRSWLWGPTPGQSVEEPLAGATGGKRLVQYFDKARMELNDEIDDAASPWRVSTGLLVSELVEGRIQTGPDQFIQAVPAQVVVAGDSADPANPRYADFSDAARSKAADHTGEPVSMTLSGRGKLASTLLNNIHISKYITETGHNIPGIFWDYMHQTGPVSNPAGTIATDTVFDWLYVMGYPITEAYWTTITIDGRPQTALIQLFQRRVLTYVPSFKEGWQVQMDNVGQHYYDWRYKPAQTQNQAAPAPPTPDTQHPTPTTKGMPPLLPATGAFVGVSGSSFTYAGSEIKLKGTNYWLSQAPFVGTWSEWNGPQAMAELEKAHELGVNTVRIGIPFDHRDSFDVLWGDDKEMTKVSPWIKNQLTQLLQIASIYGMKVIFVLFEYYDKYPPQGSRQEQPNLAYLQGIVGTFANDDRVLAWDLHNEPDFYNTWKNGSQDEVIGWLHRMASYVRALDNRHMITVGVGDYRSLYYPATDGTTILSFIDFAALHCYNAGALSGQIADLKERTTKPILLEEMGWPTALGGEPPTDGAVFDEATQKFLYTAMLNDSKAANIAGVVQWTLWDYWGGQTNLIPGHERYFGLVRQDGAFKPAADVFKTNYTGRILPSDTRTNVPLDTSDKPNARP